MKLVRFQTVINVGELGEPPHHVSDRFIDVADTAVESVREVGSTSVITLRTGTQFTVSETLDGVRKILGAGVS